MSELRAENKAQAARLLELEAEVEETRKAAKGAPSQQQQQLQGSAAEGGGGGTEAEGRKEALH